MKFLDLVNNYKSIGLSKGDNVLIASAMWRLSPVHNYNNQCKAHADAIFSVIGDCGSIIVSTSSQNLCNTDNAFNIGETPSFERGAFSEYIRKQPGSARSMHPFNSYSALGPISSELVKNISSSAYGPDSVDDRMGRISTKFLALGSPLNIIQSVHHVEHVVGVPYRYHKEFNHPIAIDNDITYHNFYLYVKYLNSDVKNSLNKRIFNAISEDLKIATFNMGRSNISSYSYNDFISLTTKRMTKDKYIWCENTPNFKPWRE